MISLTWIDDTNRSFCAKTTYIDCIWPLNWPQTTLKAFNTRSKMRHDKKKCPANAFSWIINAYWIWMHVISWIILDFLSFFCCCLCFFHKKKVLWLQFNHKSSCTFEAFHLISNINQNQTTKKIVRRYCSNKMKKKVFQMFYKHI